MRKVWVSLFISLLCSCSSLTHQWPAEEAPLEAIRPDGPLVLKVKYERSEGRPQGSAILKVHLGADGRAKYVSLYQSSGHKGIDDAAFELAWSTAFKPFQRSGRAIEVTALVPVHVNVSNKSH